jgi:hypothetical protein
VHDHSPGLLHAAATLVDGGLVALAAAIVLWAFYAAVRYTVRPGEEDRQHVKHRILVDEDQEPR